MCGVVGVTGHDPAIDRIYPALIALQHRGQDSAGAVTFEKSFHLKKGNGLVSTVFNQKNLERLRGTIGIGHVRYPTVGKGSAEDAQPFIITTPFGIALAHNGNLVNYHDLRRDLIENEFRYLNSQCDAEIILNYLSIALSKENLAGLKPDIFFRALRPVYEKVIGSFAVVSSIASRGLLAFRDAYGVKPLVYGKNADGYCFASESVALDLLGYCDIVDVRPGEAIFIDNHGTLFQENILTHPSDKQAACIFEYVYFARPDSIIDGIGVYEARLRLGEELGKECACRRTRPDVVIPIPDTARASAQMVAAVLGVPYREGLIKNRYIHRTFIMATQAQRVEAIRFKLNPIRSEIRNKKVLLVDDSIVRGNTAREIIELVRSAGAKQVHFASYSPPLRFPCVYGIDMQTKGEFIARDKSLAAIKKEIHADGLVYQSVEGLIRGVGAGRKGFCAACFTGSYPTEIPSRLLKHIEADRQKKKAFQLDTD